MRAIPFFRLCLSGFVAIALIGDAFGQSTPAQERSRDLVSLAGAFGALHHLRRACGPRRENDLWREKMKNLIGLEEPDFAVREAMVRSFNEAYRSAQARHQGCSRGARDEAAYQAEKAGRVVERLAAPLASSDDAAYIEPITPLGER